MRKDGSERWATFAPRQLHFLDGRYLPVSKTAIFFCAATKPCGKNCTKIHWLHYENWPKSKWKKILGRVQWFFEKNGVPYKNLIFGQKSGFPKHTLSTMFRPSAWKVVKTKKYRVSLKKRSFTRLASKPLHKALLVLKMVHNDEDQSKTL